MNAFLLFASSFTIVFAFAFQQHNIHYRRYRLALANALLIDLMQLVLFKLGTGASSAEMAAFLMGGPLGTMMAMWLNDKVFIDAGAQQLSRSAGKDGERCR